jgi:hypothetical protein
MRKRLIQTSAVLVIVLVFSQTAGADEPEPLLSIEKKGFASSLGVLMNVWLVPYAGEDCWYGDPVMRPGVEIHRTTLMARGRTPYGFDFKADLTLGLVHEHEADFEAVEIGWSPAAALRIVGGYGHHAPFTAVAMTDHQDLLFAERPLGIEYMIPRGQPGLRFESEAGEYFFATAGLFKMTEWEQDFLFAARVVATPLKKIPAARWGFGSTEEGYNEFRFGLGASFMSYKGDMGSISGLGADISAFWRFFSFAAEFIFFKHVTPGPMGGTETLYDTKTAYGQAGFFVWKDRLSLDARYQWYDGHLMSGEKLVRHRITGGVHVLFFKKRLRISMEYIHQIDKEPRMISDTEKAGDDNEIAFVEIRIFL